MSVHIFLGSPIHHVKNYCLPSWIDSIKNIEGVNIIMLANTSSDEDFTKYANALPFHIISAPGTNVFNSIGKGRSMLMKSFLESKATHFFSLECDIFVEPSIIQNLSAYRKKIVSIPYILGYMYTQERRLKSDYLISITNHNRVHYTMDEFLKEAKNNPLVNVNEAGMGCSLIERSVIEAYYARATVSDTRCDDQEFYKFCRNNNIPRFASAELIQKIKHYPHFHMDYGVYEQHLKRKEMMK